jgi:hypothetical protein
VGGRVVPRLAAWDLFAIGSFLVWCAVILEFQLLPFLIGTAGLHENVTPVLEFATVPLSLALLAVGILKFRDRRLLAPVYAISGVVAALALFEDTWHAFGALSPSYGYPLNQEGWLILGSWTAFGFATASRWRPSPYLLAAGSGFAAMFVLWYTLGYPQLGTGGSIALGLNWATKFLAFLVILALLVPGTSWPTAWSHQSRVPEAEFEQDLPQEGVRLSSPVGSTPGPSRVGAER